MLRKPLLLMLATLALAGTAAGCGSEDEPAGTSAPQQETTDGGGNAQPSQDVEAAIEACKQSVRDRPELSAELKAELEGICEEADSANPEDAKAASRRVCERMIEESVPEGPARDQALETCRTATE